MRTIEEDEVPDFARSVSGFDERLEDVVAERGWFREPPVDSVNRWSRRAAVVLIGWASLASSSASTCPATGCCWSARRPSWPPSPCSSSRAPCRSGPWRARGCSPAGRLPPDAVAGRSSRRAPWTRSSAAGSCPGWRRPTRPWSGRYSLGLHEEAEEVLERSMEDVRTGDASPTRTVLPALVRHRATVRRSHQRRGPDAHGRALLERRGARLHRHDGRTRHHRGGAIVIRRAAAAAAAAASVAAAPVVAAVAPAVASTEPGVRSGHARRGCARTGDPSAPVLRRSGGPGRSRLVCSHGCRRHDGGSSSSA